jgi:hypothetical protein
MIDIFFILLIISYFILAYLISRWIYGLVKNLNWIIRFIILSFCYALLFGMGAIGGGGPHGFALPAPVIFAAWYADSDRMVNNAIIPFFFWWGLILVIMILNFFFKKGLVNNKKATG